MFKFLSQRFGVRYGFFATLEARALKSIEQKRIYACFVSLSPEGFRFDVGLARKICVINRGIFTCVHSGLRCWYSYVMR